MPLPKESASTARSGVGPINCISSAKATPTMLPRNSKGMGGKQLSEGSGPSECQTKGKDFGVTSRAKPRVEEPLPRVWPLDRHGCGARSPQLWAARTRSAK